MVCNGAETGQAIDRVNLILQHPDYREYLKRNEAAEVDRCFCRHNLSHFLDVARIAYIMNLEQGLGYPKDIIYGVGLLHDIGRWKQYMESVPHPIASKELAEPILIECGYHDWERRLILDAVLSHSSSNPGKEKKNSLEEIIYKADKASRACFWCKAALECDWSEEKKNHEIRY